MPVTIFCHLAICPRTFFAKTYNFDSFSFRDLQLSYSQPIETVPVAKHGKPLSGGIVMYAEPEVLIKLSPVEIQQALAIELDRDPSQALQFIKEKIVDKYFKAPCKLASLSGKGAAP